MFVDSKNLCRSTIFIFFIPITLMYIKVVLINIRKWIRTSIENYFLSLCWKKCLRPCQHKNIRQNFLVMVANMLTSWRTCWWSAQHVDGLDNMLVEFATCWRAGQHAGGVRNMLASWTTCWWSSQHVDVLDNMLVECATCMSNCVNMLRQHFGLFHGLCWSLLIVQTRDLQLANSCVFLEPSVYIGVQSK